MKQGFDDANGTIRAASPLHPSPARPRRGSELSRWCLVAAIAAIGMKTQLKELATVGVKPVLLMLAETTFLAVLVLALLRWAI